MKVVDNSNGDRKFKSQYDFAVIVTANKRILEVAGAIEAVLREKGCVVV